MRAAGPGYWMHETSGVLRPVVEAYIAGELLTGREVGIMRAYLRQWIAADFRGVDGLRRGVGQIRTTRDVQLWLSEAFKIGIDPL